MVDLLFVLQFRSGYAVYVLNMVFFNYFTSINYLLTEHSLVWLC
jgi:hypothetical protein